MLFSVLPKWGGRAVQVDRVINDLAKRTQAAHGEIYYARMYASHAMNTNGFARFACLARDKATLLELLEQISSKPLLDHWGSNPSRTFETCKRWAAEN